MSNPWKTLAALLLLGLMLPVAAVPARPGDAVEQAQAARTAYAEGRFGAAVDLLEPLVDRYPHDARLLYNLGTAYARDGQRGEAIWRLLQARLAQPRDADIRHNLRQLAPRIEEELAITPLPPLNWIYWSATSREWALLASGLTLTGSLLLSLGLLLGLKARLRRPLIRLAMPLLVAAVLCWPLAISHYIMMHERWQGVVVAEQAVARTGPSEKQIETFHLPPGTLVHIEGEPEPGWLRVRFQGDKIGFVQRSAIATL